MWDICVCKKIGVNSFKTCSRCGGTMSMFSYKTIDENRVMINHPKTDLEKAIKDRINELKSKLSIQCKGKLSKTIDEFKIANLEIRIDELQQLLLILLILKIQYG